MTRAVGINQALSPVLTVAGRRILPQSLSSEITNSQIQYLRRGLTKCSEYNLDPNSSARLLLLEKELKLLEVGFHNPKIGLFTTYSGVELYNDVNYWLNNIARMNSLGILAALFNAPIKSSNDPIFNDRFKSPKAKKINNGSYSEMDKLGAMTLCGVAQRIVNECRRSMRGAEGVDILRVRLRAASLEIEILRQSVEGDFEPILTLPALLNNLFSHLRLVRRGCQERGLPSADQIGVLRPIPRINFSSELRARIARIGNSEEIGTAQTQIVSWVRERYSLEKIVNEEKVDETILFGLQNDLAGLWKKGLDEEDISELGALEGEVYLLISGENSPNWNLLSRAKALFDKYE